MKENLNLLIKSVKSELELVYSEVIDNPCIIDKQRNLIRYGELNNFLNIYQRLYEIDSEIEFRKILSNYVDMSINTLKENLDKNIDLENFEKCAEIKNEIDIIKQLKV